MTDDNGDNGLPVLALRRVQAAKSLGISPRKLDELVADRTSGIPVVRLGTRVVFPVDLLRQWLADQAQEKGGDR